MASIFPNSVVYLLSGIDVDIGYNHSYYFSTPEEQQLFFFATAVQSNPRQPNTNVLHDSTSYYGMVFPQTYQRTETGTIRVGIPIEKLLTCNYLVFRNTAFENKYFYAFVTAREYVNNNATEISYVIDVMQTYLFDWEFMPCFVQRQHTVNDIYGAYLAEEPIKPHDYNTYSYTTDKTGYLGGIITTKQIPSWDVDLPNVGKIQYSFENNPLDTIKSIYTPGDSFAGVANGLWLYTGIPLDDLSAKHIMNKRVITEQLYAIGRYMAPVLGDTELTIARMDTIQATFPGIQYNTISNLIYTINTSLNPVGFSADNIVKIFAYPMQFSSKIGFSLAATTGLGSGVGFQTDKNVAVPRVFDGYRPKNKKIFTFPFSRVRVSDTHGTESVYYLEDFSRSIENWGGENILKPNVTFHELTIISATPEATIYPYNYRKITENYNEGLSNSAFPELPFAENAYREWINQHGIQLAAGLLTGAITAYSGAAALPKAFEKMEAGLAGIASLEDDPKQKANKQERSWAMADARRLYNEGKSQYNKGLRDIEAGKANIFNEMVGALQTTTLPNNTNGLSTSSLFNTAFGRNEFELFFDAPRLEDAMRIDRFFEKFGYALNVTTLPNIAARPYWTYLKTQDCIIKQKSPAQISAEDEHLIAAVFDRGITFWRASTGVHIGDYSQDNSVQ